MTYEILVKETWENSVQVEAESYEEAKRIVQEMYTNGDISMDDCYFTQVEFIDFREVLDGQN